MLIPRRHTEVSTKVVDTQEREVRGTGGREIVSNGEEEDEVGKSGRGARWRGRQMGQGLGRSSIGSHHIVPVHGLRT